MKLEYENKVNLITSPLPRKNKVTADDLNDIKEVVNKNAGDLLWENESPTSRNDRRNHDRARLKQL